MAIHRFPLSVLSAHFTSFLAGGQGARGKGRPALGGDLWGRRKAPRGGPVGCGKGPFSPACPRGPYRPPAHSQKGARRPRKKGGRRAPKGVGFSTGP
ncbi:hypothetical protein HMPREF0262_03675 [Clostridium sp. ATCC 29733]|nr:hypothetical protein HMPREF0262_03675 [Clostridium sp. ATCC 29733]